MDDKEFAQRLSEMRRRLYRIAYMYLWGESSALASVDEAAYLGLRSLKKLKSAEHFETWMTRILINVCKRELRRMKKEKLVEAVPEKAGEQYDSLGLKEAVRLLPEDLRCVVILRYFAGYTLAEAASCLDIPQGTAASRQRRALKLLKLELEE
jgi:RNA polymerase sigma-70 factor (ECF subfamily)